MSLDATSESETNAPGKENTAAASDSHAQHSAPSDNSGDEWGDSLFVEGKSQQSRSGAKKAEARLSAALVDGDWDKAAVPARLGSGPKPELDWEAETFVETPKPAKAAVQTKASDRGATEIIKQQALQQTGSDDWEAQTFTEGPTTANPPQTQYGSARKNGFPLAKMSNGGWESETFSAAPREAVRREPLNFGERSSPGMSMGGLASFPVRRSQYSAQSQSYQGYPSYQSSGRPLGRRPDNWTGGLSARSEQMQDRRSTGNRQVHAEQWEGSFQERQVHREAGGPTRFWQMDAPPVARGDPARNGDRDQGSEGDLPSRYDLPQFVRPRSQFPKAEKSQAPPGFQSIVALQPTVAPPQELITNAHGSKDFYADDLPMNSDLLKEESHFRAEVSWESFGLPAELAAEVRRNNYAFPSKIQAYGIDLLMKPDYDNAVVQAPTGSGKTLTFVLSTLSLIDRTARTTQVICTAPTVELLSQLTQEYQKYARALGISVSYVRRGSEGEFSQVLLMAPAYASLLFQMRRDDLQQLRFFVADEADHLLNKEDQHDFATNMAIVIKQLPATCKILLFSATYSETVRRDLSEWLERGFVEISVPKEDLVLENIKMHYVKRSSRETKLEILMKILRISVPGVTVIFVNTVKFAQVLAGILERRGVKVAILVGRCMSTSERALTAEDFKKGFYSILVSTNLMARGIDNTHVSRVINFDIPSHWTSKLVDAEMYLHRIGRAGRFTRTGQAITIVSSDSELKMLEDIMIHFGCEIENLQVE